MANAVAVKAYASPQEAVRSISENLSKKPLLEYTTNYVNKLYENGFYAVNNPYISGGNRIILNRSKGAESNFFAIVEAGAGAVNVYFSDPRTGEEALRIKKNDVIVNYKYGGGIIRLVFGGYENPAKGFEIAGKTIEFSKYKKENEYRCYLHSHLGYVNVNGNDEALWGDGRTKDIYWILHTILAHGDVHALTEHNWTQNGERLESLNANCGNFNIVFVPGWENTTTVNPNNPEDVIKSPHILCYCANIDVAMEVKYEFLIQKLKKDEPITPIFCGVPVPFDEHIKFMNKYRDMGKLGVIIAHPFSALPGIDLYDPMNVKKLGIKKIKETFEFVNGAERYNGAEDHGPLNLDINDKKELGGYAAWLRKELSARGLPTFLSAPNLNNLIGLMAKENGKHFTYGQDDHLLYDIGPKSTSTYLQGYTRLVVPDMKFQKLKEEGRKITSEEFVKVIINGKFEDTTEPSILEAVAYAKMTNKGPDIVKARKQTTFEGIIEKIRSIPYYTNLAKLTMQYWYADHVLKDEKKIEEIAKELEKEKSYNLKSKQNPKQQKEIKLRKV